MMEFDIRQKKFLCCYLKSPCLCNHRFVQKKTKESRWNMRLIIHI